MSIFRNNCKPPLAAYLWSLRALAFVAFGISVYLLLLTITGQNAVGCGGSSWLDCGDVLNSTKWSTWLGVPVSLGAMNVYGAIFVASWFIGGNAIWRHQRIAWYLLAGCAVLAAGAAVWFVGVQILAVDGFCPYCLAVHLCGLLIAALVIVRLPFKSVSGVRPLVRPTPAACSAGAGLAVLGIIIVGQLTFEDRVKRPTITRNSSRNISRSKQPTDTPIPTPSTYAIDKSKGPEVLQLGKARTPYDYSETPVYGNRRAPHMFVKLFDYTCTHCRSLHREFENISQRYGDQIGFVLAPMPLSPECNRRIRKASRDHINACKYARLALGVWFVDRAAFDKFHEWLLEPKNAPPVDEARAYAITLVGEQALEEGINDARIQQQINMNVRLHSRLPKPGVPALLSRDFSFNPVPANTVYNFLEKKMGIRPLDQKPEVSNQ